MNKGDLVARVSMETGLSKRQTTDALDGFLRAITSAVAKDERVTIPGFGTFERRERAARTARNPRTGQTVRVAPTAVPAFRPGADFKDIVRRYRRRPGGGPKAVDPGKT